MMRGQRGWLLLTAWVVALGMLLSPSCDAVAQGSISAPCSVVLTPPAGGDAYPALQNALNRLPIFGGTICFANGTYYISSPLDLTNRIAIALRATGYNRAGNDIQAVNLVYTAASGSLINADGTRGLEIAGMNLAYSHPSYTGTLIALKQVYGATNTVLIYIHDNRIGGLSTSSYAASSLIAMELAYDVTIERNTFLNAAVAILGAQRSVINANAVTIRDNIFLQGFTDTHVKAGGQVWTLEGNTFEPINMAREASAFDTTSVGVRGLKYSANWHGDASSGLWFGVTGGPILGGSISNGNQFQGIGTTEGVDLGASKGVVVMGNEYETGGTPLHLDTATNVLAYANNSTGTAVVTRQPGPQTLYWEYINVSNADDTYVSSSEYLLPAGTLGTNGDKLIVEMDLVFGNTPATKIYQCNIGYTSWDEVNGFTGGTYLLSSATTAASVSVHARGEMTRLNTTAAEKVALHALSNGGWQTSAYATGTVPWGTAHPLRCHANSSVATAGVVTVKNLRVTLFPR